MLGSPLPTPANITILLTSYFWRIGMGVQERLTTVVSTKGQVILPKAIRDLRHWPAGTRLTVEDTPDGVLLKPVPAFPETSIDTLFGSLHHEGPALSIEDMNAAIAREAKRRARD
ncbi:MAG TPA: AbrB/MazE/SpoVT family DNA-binding domain-containing protein [Sphingobium sp.]|nr:AbrB/MazE/SpoVT family DNA-binding domain-containing protein [Sphingobium sp.]